MTPAPHLMLEQKFAITPSDDTNGERMVACGGKYPTGIVFALGHWRGLTIESHHPAKPNRFQRPNRRCPCRLAGANTIRAAGNHPSFLPMPVIPSAIRREDTADA